MIGDSLYICVETRFSMTRKCLFLSFFIESGSFAWKVANVMYENKSLISWSYFCESLSYWHSV